MKLKTGVVSDHKSESKEWENYYTLDHRSLEGIILLSCTELSTQMIKVKTMIILCTIRVLNHSNLMFKIKYRRTQHKHSLVIHSQRREAIRARSSHRKVKT